MPLEVHRMRGTWRADRHGPKLGVVARPALYLSLPPGSVQDYLCEQCDAALVIELLTDRSWRVRHAERADCAEWA